MGEGGGGGLGWGYGCPVGGGQVWVLDSRFSVPKGVELGSPMACCLVSLLDIRLLRPIRLHLNRAGLPYRYRILNPG